jgi:adenylate cyclase
MPPLSLVERRARLWSGLLLFAYVTMHLVNHAFGIHSMETMQRAGRLLLDPWQSLPGLVLLYGAALTHIGLGLTALYRRRHLRMSRLEAVQAALGLAVPVLLISHAGSIRYADIAYGAPVGFERVLYQLWVVQAPVGPVRQTVLLLIVWVHGCLGLRNWLRPRPWYQKALPGLTALATLVPMLATIGFVEAGLDMRRFARSNPEALPTHVVDVPGTAQAAAAADIADKVGEVTLAYLLLVVGIFGLRTARDWHAARFRSIRISYPGGRVVTVGRGFSVLEASRWAGIPHTAVCGGRGRCSTCRVEITAGGESLPPPGADEARLLARIGAPESVRLACQIRPTDDISVIPLVAGGSTDAAAANTASPGVVRRETVVAALFVDLRQSTRLADDRLPYDALFIVERYIKMVAASVRANRGRVTNIAGDGVMSVFGFEGSARKAATDGLRAARDIMEGMAVLNATLGHELKRPLRIGIGLHAGVAVVAGDWRGGIDGMPFLGDTGNVAARLEAETKRLDAAMVVSKEVLDLLEFGGTQVDVIQVALPGKTGPLLVVCVNAPEEIDALLSPDRETAGG